LLVSFNTRELTLKCLETLFAATRGVTFDVVLWDNASKDGSADAVAERFPQVRLIRSPENLGFAAANNRAAEDIDTEWLLLLNTDTEVFDGAIERLLEFGRAHPENGIYGGRTVFPDGSLNPGSAWNRITPWSAFCLATGLVAAFRGSTFFNTEAIAGWKRDSVREVDIVTGCFFLIRTALWRQLGGFDPLFWMYGEEADLCLRARALGYRPIITPDATIMHLGGASRQSDASRIIQLAKARATLAQRHWSPIWQPWGKLMGWIWVANRYVAARLMRAARLAGSERRYAVWSDVWSKRASWMNGWVKS
jgi:hypothetical protein